MTVVKKTVRWKCGHVSTTHTNSHARADRLIEAAKTSVCTFCRIGVEPPKAWRKDEVLEIPQQAYAEGRIAWEFKIQEFEDEYGKDCWHRDNQMINDAVESVVESVYRFSERTRKDEVDADIPSSSGL